MVFSYSSCTPSLILSLFGSCSIFLIGSDFAFRLLSLSLFAEEYVFLFYLFPSIILTSSSPFSLDLARSHPNRTA